MGPHRLAPVLIGVGFALAPTVASAADLIAYGTSTNQQLPVAPAGSYDWTGFYAGVYGVDQAGSTSGNAIGLGALAGANLAFDYFLVGGEVAVHGLVAGSAPTTYGQALGRIGVFAGGDALIYASAGAGLNLGVPDEQDLLVGGGLEYAVTNDVSLRAQYLHGFPLDGTSESRDQFTLGANYHF